jgi:hypothetical protein
MQIDRVIAKGQYTEYTFTQADVAASQTDVQLSIQSVDNAADDQLAVTGYIAPFAGEIVAIAWKLTAAGTTGTFTIGPTVGGTEKSTLTQTVGTAASGRATALRGSIPFAAGDEIGAEITTGGTWDGTGADLVVQVGVLYYLEGI